MGTLTEPGEPVLKGSFDVALSALGLLLSALLWAVIAAAIKLEEGGAVLYAQERVGQGGRRFWSWKFRSMVPDAARSPDRFRLEKTIIG